MKALHFDAINPYTGTPFTFDDPNLRFVNGQGVYLEDFDEGFTPYATPPLPPAPAKPKKRPFHRSPKTSSNPTTAPTTRPMSTFKYNVSPNPNGGYTTRVVLGEQIVEADLTAEIAAVAGVTPVQVQTVIKTLCAKLLECSKGSCWSPSLYEFLTIRPTSGGSETAPDAFHTPDDINAYVNVAFTADNIRDWKGGLSIQSQGEVGLVTPVIDSIIDITTATADHYTVANMIQLRGNNLRFKASDLTQGTFFRSGNAAEVRGTLYGQNEPGIVSVAVPAALSGPLTVRHASFINGSVRSYTYTHAIV